MRERQLWVTINNISHIKRDPLIFTEMKKLLSVLFINFSRFMINARILSAEIRRQVSYFVQIKSLW